MTKYSENLNQKQRDVRIGRTFPWFFAVFVLISPIAVAADTITAFAASSLRDAASDIAKQYEQATGDDVVLVFAASSSIARQVALGAPADVVLLADEDWANWLVEEGAVPATLPFATNRLVLVGRDMPPLRDPEGISEVLGRGMLAMAQVDAVPAGRYGKAALESLGIWEDLQPRVVQAANVRAALRFVERGEAPLGIGYASDLVALRALSEVYGFGPETHPPIVYSGAAVTPQGADLMSFILSSAGRSTLGEWGFMPAQGAP